MPEITKELIELCRTSKRGYTSRTINIFCKIGHCKSGWKTKSIGKQISEDQLEEIRKDIERRNKKLEDVKAATIQCLENALKNKGKTKEQRKQEKKERKKARREKKNKQYQKYNGDVNSPEFLQSYEWRKVRMIALKKHGARCCCCGASAKTGAVIHVDHIKPRRKFPELALDPDNLQPLCSQCNHGKGNWDMTDWR